MKLKTKKIVAREFLIFLTLAVIAGIGAGIPGLYNYWQTTKINRLKSEQRDLRGEIITLSESSMKPRKQKAFYWDQRKNCNAYKLWEFLEKQERAEMSYVEFVIGFGEIDKQKKLHKFLIDNDWEDRPFSEFRDVFFGKRDIYSMDTLNKNQVWTKFQTWLVSGSLATKYESEWNTSEKKLLRDFGIKSSAEMVAFIEGNTLSAEDSANLIRIEELNKDVNQANRGIEVAKFRKIGGEQHNKIALTVIICAGFVLFLMRYLYYSVRWSLRALREKV
jgi:hypothetical protein